MKNIKKINASQLKYVTGFAKGGLPHTSPIYQLMINNLSRLEKAIDLKFGQ